MKTVKIHPKIYFEKLMAIQEVFDRSKFGMANILPKGCEDEIDGIFLDITPAAPLTMPEEFKKYEKN